MNDLQIFQNPQFGEVRAVEIDGEPWFVGKDVAAALGYKNPQEAIRTHVDEDDKGVSEILTPGGRQNMPVINESGLYSLILSSKLPEAKKFKRWVTSEVLPSIRKHGAYLTPAAAKALEDLPAMMELLDELAGQVGDLEDRLSALECRRALPSGRLQSLPAVWDDEEPVPGLAAKKRWMRTVSEKLDLLSIRFNMTNNEILHRLYINIEKMEGVSLEEAKLRTMEEQDLTECSVLTAIFYNPLLRTSFQKNVDYNLALENRGW